MGVGGRFLPPTSCSCVWPKIVRTMLMVLVVCFCGMVRSFHPPFMFMSSKSSLSKTLNGSRKNHHVCLMRRSGNEKGSKDGCSIDDLISKKKCHEDGNGFTRRQLIQSIGPALGMAFSLLENPDNANAVEATNRAEASASTPSNAMLIPFSSVRDQKVITLSNGLQVLLVNDKIASQSNAALVVEGPGQFTDFKGIQGLAHLMEHMILSTKCSPNFSKEGDFEEWLSDNEGASNAYTAYEQTCFYFNCPHHIFPQALERFACLFDEANIVDVCRNAKILAREIRRVDSENSDNIKTQLEFVTKTFVNPEHPYTKNSRGNLETLETNVKDINVGEQLIEFFRRRYLPSRAVLVVISNQQDLLPIESWVAPFSVALSKQNQKQAPTAINHYPGRFLQGRSRKHLVLYDSSPGIGKEKLIIKWVLNEDYRGATKNNAVEIAFVLNQILGRRGPGSLYLFLSKQGWIQNTATVPLQVKVPINVSGFQILKLELSLSLEGFLNRSKVVAAIYDCIEALRNPGTQSFVIPRTVMAQYATTAKLFGYDLAPRPPDAVELATDSVNYGINTVKSGQWYRFPSTEEFGGLGLNRIRRAVNLALLSLSDPEDALIIVTAGTNAIAMTRRAPAKHPLAPLSSSKWKREKISGAQVYFEDMLQLRPWTGQTFLSKNAVNPEGKFLPPFYNPFVLTSLRTPRPSNMVQTSSILNRSENFWSSRQEPCKETSWSVLTPGKRRITLPRASPETNCRCIFVLQLLSSRPTRATAEQAANSELWKLTFDAAATDLAELGAPGGLAYELSFNKYGLRISFLGLSKTIPSYARRIAQLLVKHQHNLLKGPKTLPKSIISSALTDANRARALSPSRRRIVTDTIQKSSSYDVAQEGTAFLQSCKGAVSFSEGDLTRSETENLLDDLRKILASSIGCSSAVEQQEIIAIPSVDELTDMPKWKPRNAAPCYIAGLSLMSDACGRVPR